MADKTFKIITLGCKVNQYESAYIQERFEEKGICRAPKNKAADIIVINTCIVTGKASYQSRQAIRKAVRENPSGKIAAVGCYAQVFPEELSGIRGLDVILGNSEKSGLTELLLNNNDLAYPYISSQEFKKGACFEPLPIKRFSNRTRAFLKIQDGCESFCSYCIVPFARGPLRSLPPGRVIEALKSFNDIGYREVVLSGVHLGKYGVDLEKPCNLKMLLRQIGKQGLPMRIRLSSLEPGEIDRELIDMVASEDWLCRHFHISLQSGDDKILKRMKRRYTSGEFRELIHYIKTRIPVAAVGVDIMAGFPGEDDLLYGNTFSLIKDLPVSYLHVFPFSARAGTAAARFDDRVQPGAIKKRAEELRKLGTEKRETFYRSCLGKNFSVITEGWHTREKGMIKGLTDNYLQVVFPSGALLKNHLAKVHVIDQGRQALICKLF